MVRLESTTAQETSINGSTIRFTRERTMSGGRAGLGSPTVTTARTWWSFPNHSGPANWAAACIDKYGWLIRDGLRTTGMTRAKFVPRHCDGPCWIGRPALVRIVPPTQYNTSAEQERGIPVPVCIAEVIMKWISLTGRHWHPVLRRLRLKNLWGPGVFRPGRARCARVSILGQPSAKVVINHILRPEPEYQLQATRYPPLFGRLTGRSRGPSCAYHNCEGGLMRDRVQSDL